MQPSRARAMKKHVILFLAANPRDTDRLALDREARAIHVELKRSGYRDRFDFQTRWAAEPLDLLRELRESRPTIVQFSGHGVRPAGAPEPGYGRDVVATGAPSSTEPGGLMFGTATGDSRTVTPEAIAQTFGAVDAPVRLVLLNACYSAPIAKALLAHVDCVVGMTGAIHDDAARSFAIGFYGGLGEHESIAAAFEQGKAAIRLDGLADADRPQLQVRDGFDAAQLILAAIAPSVLVAVPCPYPGLRPFAADDAESFHGRDAEIAELIGRLRAGQREIFVIGPSGSGKSSLVSAGVLPRLARGLSGAGPFVVRELRPGDHPHARLCQALDVPPGEPLAAAERIAELLAHRAPSASVLIVVDQLEELFTQADADQRGRFLDALRALRTVPRCAVIFTLRADFSGALMESPLWPERPVQIARVDVIPLRGEALREAIAAPARAVGVTVEPELIGQLVADAASEPGILPLLQETLVQLWDARVDQTLTLADYQALGDGVRSGLAVALARRADATLQRFTAAQTDIARQILLRLISFGEGRSDTRRQQPRAALRSDGESAADFDAVLQPLVEQRLVTVTGDEQRGDVRVDLAHEILIHAWPTFADWIRTWRAHEQRRRELEAAATAWCARGRGDGGLLDAIELAAAVAWRTQAGRALRPTAELSAFLAASGAAEAYTRRQRRRRVQLTFAGLALFAVVTSVLALVARRNAAEANAQRSELGEAHAQRGRLLGDASRFYQETGRQRLIETRRALEALPYLVAAREASDASGGAPSSPLRMLFAEATTGLPRTPPLQHQGFVVSVAFSPDGREVITASTDHTARIWDAATGKPIASLAHQDMVHAAEFSPDGKRIVTASWDHTARVWDTATGRPISPPLEHQEAVHTAVFSPDGRHVVTASADHTARVWDAATGAAVSPPLRHRAELWHAAFSPDGRYVVTASADGAARIWDAVTGRPTSPPLAHRGAVVSASFSPDGTRVVTASEDHTARLWDAATGSAHGLALEHLDTVSDAEFSLDGTRVVTASRDGTARVWSAATGQSLTPPLHHAAAVASAVFSIDGTRVVTGSWDNTARVWEAATGQPLTPPLAHEARVVKVAFGPDGTCIATASEDSTARVWDARSVEYAPHRLEHAGSLTTAAFSPDGSRVVTASCDHTARTWDARTGGPVSPSLGHRSCVVSAAFSPDGSRVVTASEDNTARVWDAATGKPISPPLEHRDSVLAAAFSPDGTHIVTASADNTARVWDVATGKPVSPPLEHRGSVVVAAFSPDGARIVTASADHTARTWDAATGQPLGAPLVHQDRVAVAVFSPDGALLLTASWDGSARIWDAVTGQSRSRALENGGRILSAAFSPDGTRVATASLRTVRLWDAATGSMTGEIEHAGTVYRIAFSPESGRIVTASGDKTARIWDASTAQPLSLPLVHPSSVRGAAFAPDGAHLVTISDDGIARIWSFPLASGDLADWRAILARTGHYVVNQGVLARHLPAEPEPAVAPSTSAVSPTPSP